MKLSRRKFVQISSLSSLAPIVQLSDLLRLPQNALDVDAGLYKSFQNPPQTAKPFVRWWWNGDRLSKAEILRELDLLKQAGIGGVEINPIKFPEQADNMGLPSYDWLSKEWIDMLQTALQGAKERGLVCDIIVGSGWPFGGEFLEKEERTQMVAVGTRYLSGPKKHDISRQELLDEVEPYLHSKYENKFKELIMLKLVPARLDTFQAGTDLQHLIPKEDLSIQVPQGEFVLYYLVKLTGYQAVINGAPGANGPVLNHYNQAAVQKFLDRMSDGLNGKIGKLGNQVRAMFADSLELEGANWCHDMFSEFETRRGYSLAPYLPFVLFKVGHMGNPVDEEYGAKLSSQVQDQINRVRYDFEITRQQLFKERFVQTFQSWCEAQGVKSRVQAYGRGYHPLESSMSIDIPECETWLRPSVGDTLEERNHQQGRAHSMINKFVSSGARLAGKKLISCEEITNTEMVFNATLERIKIAGDQSNLSGVTHSILHGFNYSPKEAPFPGWVRYGTFFNERNPWWPYFHQWTAYKARISTLFQQSEMQSDVALMHPLADMWMQFGSQRDPYPTRTYPDYAHNVWEAIHQNGHGCDYISERILQDAKFSKARLQYGSRSYKVLLLMEVEAMHPDSAKSLKKFVEAGGMIIMIAKEPHKSPGLQNREQNDKIVSEIIGLLKKEFPQRVATVPAPGSSLLDWYKELQNKFSIQPYVQFERPVSFVNQIYYKCQDLDIFFFVNYHKEKAHQTKITFPQIKNKTAWLWDPESGERWLYPQENPTEGLMLQLPAATSKLIVFSPQKTSEKYPNPLAEDVKVLEITGSWQVSFHPVEQQQSIMAQTWNKLKDLSKDEELQSFAGTVTYQKEFQAEDSKLDQILDLGRVEGVSEVWINDQLLGNRWYGEHQYPLNGKLKDGKNHLKVNVITTLGNYMKSLKDNQVAQAWTSQQPLYPSGLIGPVKILTQGF